MNMLVTQILCLINGLLPGLPPGSEFPRSPDMNRFVSSTITIQAENANHTYPYRLLVPSDTDDMLPLVVFLHGAGERGDDNTSQLTYLPEMVVSKEHFRNKPCFLLAVQCPQDDQWAAYDARNKPPARARPAMQAVIAAILKTVNEQNIDQSRIYLTGLSMGGDGSWDLAARHPEWFAAVVPICGGGRLKTAPRLVDVPIWAFHGKDDRVVPESESQKMIEAIREAGGHPAYSSLPGVGHGSWHVAYSPWGAMNWMFAQKNPTPPTLKQHVPKQTEN